MGLTSNKVLVLAIVCAALLFIGTVWLWPRLARRGLVVIAGRVGLLLATQVALFAAVGLAANQAFGFYASWADLFGKENGQGVVVDHADGTAPAGPLKVLDEQRVEGPGGSPQMRGQVQEVAITGRTTRIASPAYVYLPPEYFRPEYRTRAFPAAIVLTGYPGTAKALVDKLHFPSTARDLARDGKMQPMILVMLRPTVAPPRDTECVDIPRGPQTESFFARDLPDAVASHYRVAKKWGVVGDSTGGYCALKLALHHPGVFTAGAGLSPYYKAPIDATTGDLFQGNATLKNEADLKWFLKHRPAPDTSLLVTSSREGENNYKATLKFIDMVKATKRTHISSIILDSGGHNFNTWRREIPATLQWVSERLAQQ